MRSKAKPAKRQVVTDQGDTMNVIAEEKTYLVVALACCSTCGGTGNVDMEVLPCWCQFSMPRPEGYDLQGMIQEVREQDATAD